MKAATKKKVLSAKDVLSRTADLSSLSADDVTFFSPVAFATSGEAAKALSVCVAQFNGDLKAAKAALAALNKAVKAAVAEHRASIAKDAAKLKAKRKAKAGGKATGATTSATVN